jgi:4-amino-4-deoxy-L-arabinose transferase-like glycosyltransferase
VFVESQGFRTRAAVPVDRPLTPDALPRRTGWLEVGRGASGPPLHAVGLAIWTRAAGTSENALRLPSELAGALAAALAALVAGQVAGPWAAAWAGGLVALSPIHTLASRNAGPEALFVFLLLASLALALRVEASGERGAAVFLGLLLGLLASSGGAAFSALAPVPLVWLAFRSERRATAGAVVAALAVVAILASLGLARSPLDFGEIPTWIPEATASGILRCTGASFTRVAGLEYHLAFPHARHVIPLTALFVGLMAWGAASLPARARGLLVAGALVPFALGATLALATGRVTPLQATRLLAGLPFVAVLMAVGLASLRGLRAWATGAAALGALVWFLTLALVRPDYEISPTQALARELERCHSGSAVVAVQRPLDLLALAAWDVPGPFVLRAARAPVPTGPAIVVGPSSACVSGGAVCGPLPACGRP